MVDAIHCCWWFLIYVFSWHKADARQAAHEGLVKSGLQTLGAECRISGGKPTDF